MDNLITVNFVMRSKLGNDDQECEQIYLPDAYIESKLTKKISLVYQQNRCEKLFSGLAVAHAIKYSSSQTFVVGKFMGFSI